MPLKYTGIPGRGWPGKFTLGHHGDDVVYAPDPTVGLSATMSGTSTLTGSLRIVEAVGLSSTMEGSSTLVGALSVTQMPAQHPNGSPATDKTPTFRYDGIDITADVEFQYCEFTASARGNPGTAQIRIRNPSMSFVTGKELTCDIGGKRLWGGYVSNVRHGYYFPAAVEQNSFVVLQGVDYNVLQQKRVIYDKVTPTKTKLTAFAPNTPDAEIIRYYAQHHTDLSGDGVNYVSGVRGVGTPSRDDEISGAAGWSFGEFLHHIRFHTGAIDYITPDKVLVHTDVDTPTAPFGISDQPGAGEIGCRDLEIDFGAEAMRNDALMWGAGQGFTQPVFSRVTDEASIEEHGLWQIGKMIPTIWRQATIDRIADSYVYGSPQNKRGGKDDRVAVRCTIFEPGLQVADKVNVRSEVWGFEDVLPIREMRVTFPTPTAPRFDLVLSHEIDDPWSTFEFFFPQINVNIPEIEIGDIPEIEVGLPPGPVWIDGEGNIIVIGHQPPQCIDGRFSYIVDDPEEEFLVTVGMSSGSFYPPDATAHIGHPSGIGYYVIDGDTGTYLYGHRWQNADAIIWQSEAPLIVSGVTITQGIGGNQKNMCGKIVVYVQYSPDGPWEAVADSGPNIPPGTLGGSQTLGVSMSNVGVYGVRASCVEPSYRFPGVFNVAGRWIVNEARLFATCKATTEQSQAGYIIGGGPGYWSPPIVDEIDPPEGEDEAYTYYKIFSPWLPGTLLVWLDGLLLDPSMYEENPAEAWIKIIAPLVGNIYVRYIPL